MGLPKLTGAGTSSSSSSSSSTSYYRGSVSWEQRPSISPLTAAAASSSGAGTMTGPAALLGSYTMSVCAAPELLVRGAHVGGGGGGRDLGGGGGVVGDLYPVSMR